MSRRARAVDRGQEIGEGNGLVAHNNKMYVGVRYRGQGFLLRRSCAVNAYLDEILSTTTKSGRHSISHRAAANLSPHMMPVVSLRSMNILAGVELSVPHHALSHSVAARSKSHVVGTCNFLSRLSPAPLIDLGRGCQNTPPRRELVYHGDGPFCPGLHQAQEKPGEQLDCVEDE